jgi:hypothetical protein
MSTPLSQKSLPALKAKYLEAPERIVFDLEDHSCNITHLLDDYFPMGGITPRENREKYMVMILDILMRPENFQHKQRFDQLYKASQSALWMIGQSSYFNIISSYKLPPDASPASIVALGKFWLQNQMKEKEAPGPSQEESDAEAILKKMQSKKEA